MKDLVASITAAIKNRTNTQFYGLVTIFWLVVHWNFVYTALFVDQQMILNQTGLLKNEYLSTILFRHDDFTQTLLTIIEHILPVVLAVFFIWIMPRLVLEPAYREEQKYRFNKRKIKAEFEKLIAENEEKAIKQEIQVAEAEQQAEDIKPEILWEREYGRIKRINPSTLPTTMNSLIDLVYEEAGEIWSSGSRNIEPDELAWADSNDLVTIKNGNVALTTKGKYFVRLYKEGR